MVCPPELRRLYHEERVIPFIGAGVSMSVSWTAAGVAVRGPSWEELVSEATRLLGFEDPELARMRGKDMQILEYFKLKNSGQTAKLKNWLNRLMNPPDDAFRNSPIHRELVALEKCRVFYTTNFDNFIEQAFRIAGRTYKVVAVEAQMGLRHEREVVKFHGDLDHPDQIVLTESDFEKRLSLSTPMDYHLRADMLGRVLLFLGYSFRDPNVSYLFSLFTHQFWEQPGSLPGNRAYIVVADPSDFEIELFKARRMTVIPVSRRTITQQIAELLQQMRG